MSGFDRAGIRPVMLRAGLPVLLLASVAVAQPPDEVVAPPPPMTIGDEPPPKVVRIISPVETLTAPRFVVGGDM
ncbi:hypothetical protein AB0085_27420, partial [Klebsiella pneumoniae]